MQLQEKAEEVLELLWLRVEEQGESDLPLDDLQADLRNGALKELLEGGLISLAGEAISLTERGEAEARNVIRRHRLAERLLADVLGSKGLVMDEKACKFEHLLDRGLDESICCLLGHPRICPHGKPIPPGRCCEAGRQEARRALSPLSELEAGLPGKVAYLCAPEPGKLQKLMAMGILPESPIELLQRFPSYVFRVGHTEFAVDKSIADAIYVRLEEGEGAQKPEERRRGRGPWYRLRRRGGEG